MFDYGVAFTGFSRVVYSPMFVLGVAFTGYFYLVCSKDHCLEKSGIQNADPDLGSLEDGWMWATSGGQVHSEGRRAAGSSLVSQAQAVKVTTARVMAASILAGRDGQAR